MTKRSKKVKRLWKACSRRGESLKRFARRVAVEPTETGDMFRAWLAAK